MRQLRSLALAGALVFPLATPLSAQESQASKLSIHGYLTQGVARADTLQMIGIDKEGTSDYRRAAILMRYAYSSRDNFTVQLAHRRLGNSPITANEPTVKLDWAYVEHTFGDGTSLRIGRAPIPLGIYNETRYVGTLMPFYRAPYSMYFEGSFVAEAIDGASATRSFFAESPMRVDLGAYAGQYALIETAQTRVPPTNEYKLLSGTARMANTLGGQLWVATPLDGLRLGGGGSRSTASGGLLRAPGTKQTFTSWHGSIDGSFDRLITRAEYRNAHYQNSLTYRAYYGQAGVRLYRGLWVNGQSEVGKLDYPSAALGTTLKIDYNRDDAVGVNYVFNPSMVLKFEGHHMKGYTFEVDGNAITAPAMKANYVITSFSVSF